MNAFELEKQNDIIKIILEYSPLLDDIQLSKLLSDYGMECSVEDQTPKEYINSLALHYYCNEAIVKHALVSQFLKDSNSLVFFEFPTGSSRADVCKINNHSCAYEIKTAYDNYDRIEKQIADYKLVFDYVYLVIPKESYEKVLNMDLSVGILTYSNTSMGLKFAYRKKASKEEPDYIRQAESMSLKQLRSILSISTAAHTGSKEDCINFIMQNEAVQNRFNSLFKKALKIKYSSNWSFLKTHFYEMQPLDMQLSFSKKVLI